MSSFEVFVSPAVITREIDMSFVPGGVASIVGTVIGLTQKGTAFVPIRSNGYSAYQESFGGTNSQYLATYAAKSYLRNSSGIYTIRILGKSDVTLGNSVQIAFPASGTTQSTTAVASTAATTNLVFAILRQRPGSSGTLSYSGDYSACTISAEGKAVIVSFDNTKENFIRKVLGSNPEKSYVGDSLTGFYIDSVFDFATSLTAGIGNITGDLTVNAVESTAYKTMSGGYSYASTPIFVSQNFGGTVYSLFALHTLSDGTASNRDVKISITNVETVDSNGVPKDWPKFDIVVRDIDDTDRRPIVIETFREVVLDPTSPRFIARVIGDKKVSADLVQNPPEIIEDGVYDIKSKYIRVEVFEGYPETARPSGFRGIYKGASIKNIPTVPYKTNHLDINSEVNSGVFMGVDFDNTSGLLDRLNPTVTKVTGGAYSNTSDSGLLLISTTSELTSSSNITGFNFVNLSSTGATYQQSIRLTVPVYGGWNGYSPEYSVLDLQTNGSLTAEYYDAAKIFSNAAEFDTNLLVTPGINSSTPGFIVDKILQKVEDRSDCFYILDIASGTSSTAGLYTSITDAVTEAEKFDTSYAACYYPWLKIYDSENDKYVWVPPSVEAFGTYAYNDSVGDIWKPPAGYNRAVMTNVKGAKKRLTSTQTDTLYKGRINHIVSTTTDGIVIMGQKTLQVRPTALDRIGVRRLLLEVRKTIASFAKFSIFEPNDIIERQKLVSVIEPYLRRIKERRGVADFKIVLDNTTTTDDMIDNYIMYGKIFLKPTKSAEYIKLDFMITRSGANFEEL